MLKTLTYVCIHTLAIHFVKNLVILIATVIVIFSHLLHLVIHLVICHLLIFQWQHNRAIYVVTTALSSLTYAWQYVTCKHTGKQAQNSDEFILKSLQITLLSI